jgi:hypothetical protein
MTAETQALRATGEEILATLNARWGVRLDAIILNEALSTSQRRDMLTARMLECALTEIDEVNWENGANAALASNENKDLIEKALTGSVEVEPNFVLSAKNFVIVRDYQGQQLTDYITTLSKRFESMSRAKTPGELALEIFYSSLIAVGTAMAKATFTAWRAGQTLLAAIKTGVTSIGIKTAVAVVIIILAAILLYLFLENPKKILGLVYNDTDDDLVVTDWRKGVDGAKAGDLFMAFGGMKNFPEDHATGDLDSPLVQLRKRAFFGPDDPDNAVFGSFFFADRNFGLRGSEGVMVLSSKTSSLRYALLFACPYSEDNGTAVRIYDGGSPPPWTLYDEMYPGRAVRAITNASGVLMISTVNAPRGGVVFMVATISKV